MRTISNASHPEAAPAAGRLFELLLMLGRKRPLRDPLALACEDSGLTAPQIHALSWLSHDGHLTMGELAHRTGITEKTITGVVDRLEREKLCARLRDLVDRRVVRVKLTVKGERLAKTLNSLVLSQLTAFMHLLDPGDRTNLIALAEKILNRITQLTKETSTP